MSEHTVQLKKTRSASTRMCQDGQEYTPASYDVFVYDVKVGEVRGWCYSRIKGSPHGQTFYDMNRVPNPKSIGVRGVFREILNEIAVEEFKKLRGESSE